MLDSCCFGTHESLAPLGGPEQCVDSAGLCSSRQLPDVALISAPLGERFFTGKDDEKPPCEEVGILIIVSACDKQRTVLIHSASRTHEGMFWEHRYRCGYPLIRLERCTNVKHNKKEANSKNKHNQLRYLCARKQVENLND